MSMRFIENPNEFFKRAKKIAHDNLLSELGIEHINSDPICIQFLSQRYIDLFEIKQIPSKQILLDYLSDEKLSNKKFSPQSAAVSCEFWAGIFYKHIERKKEPISISDFEYKLQLSYALLASQTGIYTYASSSEVANKILLAFRKTSLDLKIPTGENEFQERVLQVISN